MRAILYDRWGGPEVLRLAEVARPVPKDNEVLVRVHASSLNAWDLDLLTGKRYVTRPPGFAKGPKSLGFDVAGVVEATGRDVTRFKPGDVVFGDLAWGDPAALADYVCVKETSLAAMPEGMSFTQAAALPQAGLLALQALRTRVLRPGDKVLINGAGGGVGTLAIQMAKAQGAEVTGVDSAGKLETMRAAGADHVIDYITQDFTRNGVRYDLIIDVVANRSLSDFARALNRGGRLVVVGGTPGTLLKLLTLGPLFGLAAGKRIGLLIYKPGSANLEELKQLFVAGKLTPVIDGVFPLERTADAVRRLADGDACGKVVVTVAE